MITQIYEIQTPEEAERCIALGVDRIGSVLLSEKDWRQPAIREVIRLTKGTSTRNSLIALFQGETLLKALDFYHPHFLHFCDNLTDRQGRMIDLGETMETQEAVKARFPEIGILRSIPIPLPGTLPDFPFLEIARVLEPVSDGFLIDTWVGVEPVEGFVGITGRTCDWDRSRELVLQSAIPVILAGGLSPENVYHALLQVFPAGADSCTLTNAMEASGRPIRFRKDFARVEGFLREVRRAEEAIQGRKEEMQRRLESLQAELREREKALPAHSVRPHQILAIEALEEEISGIQRELSALRGKGAGKEGERGHFNIPCGKENGRDCS